MIFNDVRRRPIAAVAMICLVATGVGLGIWQLKRAAYKEGIATSLHEKELSQPLLANDRNWTLEEALHHRMIAKGAYLPEKAIWLENRPHPRGRDPQTGITTGFFLLMPLQLTGQKTVIWVNRGWAPRSFDQLNKVPEVRTPKGTIEVGGSVFEAAGKTYELGKDGVAVASDGLPIRENLDLVKLSQQMPGEHLPFVLRQDEDLNKDGLQRLWAMPDSGSEKHFGYAFQWFALALMSFVFWVVTGLRARSKSLR